ncbi:MAG: flagellin hook IN motif-containing protein, partial [Phycisphaerae bacterium]
MSRINTNVAAMAALHRSQRNQNDLSVRLQRLSTGLRINRGADDPAGLIVSERLRMEIGGLGQAIDNSIRASNVVTVAEGALNEASALLLDLQQLVVATANEAGLADEEVNANQLQIDSILASLNRIAATTEFAGKKLLDGRQEYLTSGIPAAALPSVELFSAQVPTGGTRDVVVRVTQSALTGRVALIGSNPTGVSTTSATTVEFKGSLGSTLLSFTSGTTLATIRTAVNAMSDVTGVTAVVSTAGVGGVASALVLSSASVGSDAFVSVEPLTGNLIQAGTAGTVLRNAGRDASVQVGGRPALVRGLQADVRTSFLDARLFLSQSFAQTLSSATFTITGGGALFQLTPQLNPNGQISAGIQAVSTGQLGTPVTGRLFTLGAGGANDFASGNFEAAQRIVAEAISQVASQRARLGNLQRNQIEPSINSQRVTLENVTASES